MALSRWVRQVSEQQLLVVAQAKVASRYGLSAREPKGKDRFWQQVYAPVFYRLPISFRNRVVAVMPGSHRQTWHQPAQATGPAESIIQLKDQLD